MTEKEKMLNGLLYNASDSELTDMRRAAHGLCTQYNQICEEDTEAREKILQKLLPNMGDNGYLQGPIQFDYGVFTTIGKNFYANFNFTVLDVCPVTIGDDVFIGPNVSILTPLHPLRYEQRNLRADADGSFYDKEYGAPIKIGNNCWIASGVNILPGVTIGDGCVIGAGSVVTHDIPPNSLAAGNPCRVIREITDDDLLNEE